MPGQPPHHKGLQARHEEQQVEASLVAHTVGFHRASTALHLPSQRAELASKRIFFYIYVSIKYLMPEIIGGSNQSNPSIPDIIPSLHYMYALITMELFKMATESALNSLEGCLC